MLHWAHPSPQTAIGSAVFAQLTAECPYALGSAPFPLKIAPAHGVI